MAVDRPTPTTEPMTPVGGGPIVIPDQAGDDELLYGCHVDSRWSSAFRSAGIDPRLLAAESGTA